MVHSLSPSLCFNFWPCLPLFPSSCSVTIEWDAFRRSICFIIWSPDVQIKGIQFLLKFTEKRCSAEQYRKGKYVHPMGDRSDCNINNHDVCPPHTHKQLKYWQTCYWRWRWHRSVCAQNITFMFLTPCQSVGSWSHKHTLLRNSSYAHYESHQWVYTITKQD